MKKCSLNHSKRELTGCEEHWEHGWANKGDAVQVWRSTGGKPKTGNRPKTPQTPRKHIKHRDDGTMTKCSINIQKSNFVLTYSEII